jgi:hypothetical protein
MRPIFTEPDVKSALRIFNDVNLITRCHKKTPSCDRALKLVAGVGFEPNNGVSANVELVPLDASCVSLIATHIALKPNIVNPFIALSGDW